MMKKLIALVLIAMLLLSGCQTNGGQGVVTDATDPTAVYDWMAGESPVIPERIGLKRAGVNNGRKQSSEGFRYEPICTGSRL